MKTLYSYLIFAFIIMSAKAQLCPGGGVDFNSITTFDPSWIYGCNTGTSCNGGVAFDNKLNCQPIVSMETCAPAPSCGNITQDASDVWFRFYASNTNVVLSCFQNTSLRLGIQALAGGPECGSLTEIGCALSSGPSGGVQVSLSGLTQGGMYYFRIFGSSSRVSQQTGIYCFCGTTGLSISILPVALNGFKATANGNKVNLEWATSSENNSRSFQVERSSDAVSYYPIATIAGAGTTSILKNYSYTDFNPASGINYYRLKQVSIDGRFTYSYIVEVRSTAANEVLLCSQEGNNELRIVAGKPMMIEILTITGLQIVKNTRIVPGVNKISVRQMVRGTYIIYNKEFNIVKKFEVF